MPYDTLLSSLEWVRENEMTGLYMQNRLNALNNWLRHYFDNDTFTMTLLAGDASFRRYFRVKHQKKQWVVMDAPPEKESIHSFLKVTQLLTEIDIHTPAIQHFSQEQGFVLLEDLGDILLLNQLTQDKADMLYRSALHTLLRMQTADHSELPCFDAAFIRQELALFQDWFLKKHLRMDLKPAEEQLLQHTFLWLAHQIIYQPQVFIHRDYHSRNIMLKENPYGIAVIDFQDAMRGPFTYDLVSLLKDCYIRWPRRQVVEWVSHFYEGLPDKQGWSLHEFFQAVEHCGLQRHLKVLGIFSRLHWRDNKSNYLNDLPLVFNYVEEALVSMPELGAFNEFIQQKVKTRFQEVCCL